MMPVILRLNVASGKFITFTVCSLDFFLQLSQLERNMLISLLLEVGEGQHSAVLSIFVLI